MGAHGASIHAHVTPCVTFDPATKAAGLSGASVTCASARLSHRCVKSGWDSIS